MPVSVTFRALLMIACIAALVGCSGDGSPLFPSSVATEAGARATSSLPADYDEPAAAPSPVPPVSPDPVPGPTPMTVSIVGSVGPGAFMPNPLGATAGSMIVWTNTDATRHVIALDNGTVVGDLAPGQSSAPIVMVASAVGYHCTLHPSMVGSISDPAAAVPPPVPPYEPPPYEPPRGGYDDYGR